VNWPVFPELNELPNPPYWAAIFLSERSADLDGYDEMDALVISSAKEQEGYLGFASINKESAGIFISYWKDLKSIEKWRKHSLHISAKALGKKQWYARYASQLAEIKHHGIKTS
jgi:heme-degrading monooxygenase HmoA